MIARSRGPACCTAPWRELLLPSGHVYYLNDLDFYECLDLFPWHAHSGGYAHRNVLNPDGTRSKLMLHNWVGERMGFTGLVDHIDRNPANNTRVNLRPVTSRQNTWSRGLRRDNSTGYWGVSRVRDTDRYMACHKFYGRSIYLGTFDTAEAAALAYNDAITYRGVFGAYNVVTRARAS